MQLSEALQTARQIAIDYGAAVEAATSTSLHLVLSGQGTVVVTTRAVAGSCRMLLAVRTTAQHLIITDDCALDAAGDYCQVLDMARTVRAALASAVIDDRVGLLMRRAG